MVSLTNLVSLARIQFVILQVSGTVSNRNFHIGSMTSRQISAVKNSLEMISRVLCLGFTWFCLFACSKPAPEPTPQPTPNFETPTPTVAPENEPAATIVPPAPGDNSLQQSPPEAVGTPAQAPESLRQKFLNTQDANERAAIVHSLGELDNAEAMAVLGLLFQNEQTEDLKLDILLTVDEMEVETVPKIPILAAAVRPEQPQSVREAAIDILADLDEPGAVPMLQSLTNDPDPEISESAKDALEDAIESEAEPSP